jgi:hypothetical protein
MLFTALKEKLQFLRYPDTEIVPPIDETEMVHRKKSTNCVPICVLTLERAENSGLKEV